jgi:quinol monooxygenase YgiN
MIYVIATIEVVQEKREDFLNEFRTVVPLVREEKGCLEYCPTIDVGTDLSAQGEVRDSTVTVVEKWESVEALEDHIMAPHMLEYRSKVKDMVASTRLQVLQPA